MNDYHALKDYNRRHRTKKHKLVRREHIARVLSRSFRTLIFLTLIIVASFCVTSLLRHIVQSSYLTVKDVQFEGCQRVTPQELMRIARINLGANVFALNLTELARQLKSNPWVKEVAINRALPHALRIRVEERVPVALVSHKNLFLLDNEGILFKEVEHTDTADMPVITGLSFSAESARLIKKVLALLHTAETNGVLKRDTISEIHIDSDTGFTFYTLQEAMPIRIGFGDYEKKFALLANILEDLRNRKLTPKMIDMISSGRAQVRVTS